MERKAKDATVSLGWLALWVEICTTGPLYVLETKPLQRQSMNSIINGEKCEMNPSKSSILSTSSPDFNTVHVQS